MAADNSHDDRLSFLTERKVNVTVCSCSRAENVSGFVQMMSRNMNDVTDIVRFRQLPFNICDMDDFDLSDVDVLLLCHSIESRRLSLTDVTDSLYDGFLPKAKKLLGKSKVGVIAHDLPESELTPAKISVRERAFSSVQTTTIESSSLFLMAGKLESDPVQLTVGQLNQLKFFLFRAASPPPKETAEVTMRRRGWPCCIPCAICCLRCCPVCSGRRHDGCLAFTVERQDPPYTPVSTDPSIQ